MHLLLIFSSDFFYGCRVCLKKDIKHAKSLLKTYNNTEWYAEIFKNCIGINIAEQEEHPPWICAICEEKLLDFYYFKSQCLKSDEVITKFLNTRSEMDIPDFNLIFEGNVIELDPEENPADDATDDSYTESEPDSIITTHDPGKAECEICQAKFPNAKSLRIHKKSHKREQDRYKSEYCSTWFQRTSSLFRHDNMYHTGERIFKCYISQEPFLTLNRLKKHILKWHIDSPNICNKPYNVHVPKPFKKCPNTVVHDCIYCNRKFPTKTNLRLHVRSFHPDPPKEESSEMQVDNDEPRESYQCEFCGKCFTDPNSFDVHKMFHPEQLEEGETLSKNAVTGNFYCSKCDLNIYQLALYEAHMDKFHGNDYSCDVCKTFFLSREHLPSHRRTHFKQNNYVCKQCDKRFLGSTLLNKHIQRYHPGMLDKPAVVVREMCFKRKTYIKIFKSN